jgi:hypothetical protein
VDADDVVVDDHELEYEDDDCEVDVVSAFEVVVPAQGAVNVAVELVPDLDLDIELQLLPKPKLHVV